jgi:nitroreductase
MSSAPNRVSEFFVDPLFIDRWSPRAFNADPISDETLFSLLEAARWAPSANNSQPWRFIYARNGGNGWEKLFSLLNDNNKRWAGQASALLLLLSKKVHARDGGQPAPLRNHSFDTGAAWASLAFQAHYLGWKTHAIGGFDREGSRQALAIPDHYNVEILVAIGKQAERDTLHPDFWEREKPNGRKPVRELAAEGEFAFSD